MTCLYWCHVVYDSDLSFRCVCLPFFFSLTAYDVQRRREGAYVVCCDGWTSINSGDFSFNVAKWLSLYLVFTSSWIRLRNPSGYKTATSDYRTATSGGYKTTMSGCRTARSGGYRLATSGYKTARSGYRTATFAVKTPDHSVPYMSVLCCSLTPFLSSLPASIDLQYRFYK